MKKHLLLVAAPTIVGTTNSEGNYLHGQDPNIVKEAFNQFLQHYEAHFAGTLLYEKVKGTESNMEFSFSIWEKEGDEYPLLTFATIDLQNPAWNENIIKEFPEYFTLLAQKDVAENFREAMRNYKDFHIDVIYSEMTLGAPDPEFADDEISNEV